MSANWTHTTLGAIADGTNGAVDGPFGSNLKASSYSKSGIPVIRGSNLSIGLSRFDSSEFVYVKDETLERLKRSECLPGDIIFTKKGTLGQTGFISNDLKYKKYLLSSNQMRLRVNTSIADPEYVYYWVSSNESIEKIKRDSEFTGVPKINLDYLKKFPIKLPKLAIQKSTANVLRSIDNKINLNTQTNQTMESIAQAIFKSWFVDFEPVKAKMAVLADGGTREQAELAAMGAISGKGEAELAQLQQQNPEHYQQLAETAALFPSAMVESELGEIPEGWDISSVEQQYKVEMGQSPKGESYNENGHGTLFYQGRAEFGTRFPTPRLFTTEPKKFASRGDILMSVRAPVGDLNIANNACCIGRGLAALNHKLGGTSFAYYELKSLHHVFDRFNGEGTVFGSINQKDLKSISVIKPSAELVYQFRQAVESIDSQIYFNASQNVSLANLRDTLLPKLLSGEIDLSDIQSEVA